MKVDTGAILLSVVQQPKRFQVAVARGTVQLKSGPFQVTARCTVKNSGAAPAAAAAVSPRNAPWKLGFMQARILETNWHYYRGTTENQGSVFVDNVANQPKKICRDYDRNMGHVWYEGSANPTDCYGIPNAAMPAPWHVVFHFGDEPEHDIQPYHHNAVTGVRNYLDEARVALGFVTTMTELAGPKQFVHHRHFFWSAIWHFKAARGPAAQGQGPFTLLPGSGFWISNFKSGGPPNGQHSGVLNDPILTRDCNELVQTATPSRQPAPDWRRPALMSAKDKLF